MGHQERMLMSHTVMETPTQENGKMENLMVQVHLNTQMETTM